MTTREGLSESPQARLLLANGLSFGDGVDTLLKLLTHLEKGELLWGNWYLFAGLRIAALVGAVLLHHEATKASYLDTTTTHKCIAHLAVDEVNDLFCLHDVD